MINSLSTLKPGDSGVIKKISGDESFSQRLISMGILPDVEIKLMKIAPFGDPISISVKGNELSLRKSEAQHISIKIKNKRN
jgi:ferrous iron transport protein A